MPARKCNVLCWGNGRRCGFQGQLYGSSAPSPAALPELQPAPKALEKIRERGFATASIVLYTQNWVVFLIQLILPLPQNCLHDN